MKNEVIFGNPENTSVFDVQTNKTNFKDVSKKSKEELDLYESTFSESSYLNPELGSTITGTIYQILDDELVVDINGKEFAYISITRDKIDVSNYSEGDVVEFLLIDNTNFLKGSILDNFRKNLYEEMQSNKGSVYTAKVICLTDNGYTLDIQGVNVFMPGSLGGINKLIDFNSLIGKTINVVPIKNENNHSKYSDQLIVSHRDYLKKLIPEEVEKLTVGSVYTGTVTDTTKFGIFVEFNDVLTGLIHKDEFDEKLKELFDSKNIKPGTEIDFYLKEIISSKRIVLTRLVENLGKKKKKENKYKKGDIIKGEITKVVNYGYFVKLDKYTSALLHISKTEGSGYFLDEGDFIKVKILDIKNNKYELDIVD